MKQNAIIGLALALAAAVVFAISASAQAGVVENSMNLLFQQTDVYQTQLKGDTIHTEAKDGVVTLTGVVAEEFHKALAETTMAGLPGVTSVDNQLVTLSEVAAENGDSWFLQNAKRVATSLPEIVTP